MIHIKQFSIACAVMLGFLVPAFALAQTSVNAGVGTSSTVRLTAAETKAKQRADQEITRRIAALNALQTRVSQMQEVSASFKASLAATVQNEITSLTNLQAKIDADTDLATLKTDVMSITADYRVFMLVLPESRIAAAADRVVTLSSMFSSLGTKLQARIQTAAGAGADVTALNAALADISAKIADVQNQAQTAVTSTVSLQPDQGDKTVEASNTAALKAARADIQAAQKDLVAARADVKTIVAGLAKLPAANASASTSAAASTTAQ
jgi:hypothetical protein